MPFDKLSLFMLFIIIIIIIIIIIVVVTVVSITVNDWITVGMNSEFKWIIPWI